MRDRSHVREDVLVQLAHQLFALRDVAGKDNLRRAPVLGAPLQLDDQFLRRSISVQEFIQIVSDLEGKRNGLFGFVAAQF